MDDWFDTLVMWLFKGFILFIVFLIVTGVGGCIYDCTSAREVTYKLVALHGGTTTEGHFFLGSGVVDGKQKYFYMVQQDDRSYRIDGIDTELAVIYEVESNFRVEVFETKLSKTKWYAKFYIPKNSIDFKFKISLDDF